MCQGLCIVQYCLWGEEMGQSKARKSPYLGVYMDPEMQAMVRQEAEKRGIGVSELVRRAVSLYISGEPSLETLALSREEIIAKAAKGEVRPESWEEFFKLSTYLFLGASKQVEIWRQYLIDKAKAEAEGLTYEEWLRKNIDEGPARRE